MLLKGNKVLLRRSKLFKKGTEFLNKNAVPSNGEGEQNVYRQASWCSLVLLFARLTDADTTARWEFLVYF
eukprot:1161346-Pelagomonas_calceolata.AAC.11